MLPLVNACIRLTLFGRFNLQTLPLSSVYSLRDNNIHRQLYTNTTVEIQVRGLLTTLLIAQCCASLSNIE